MTRPLCNAPYSDEPLTCTRVAGHPGACGRGRASGGGRKPKGAEPGVCVSVRLEPALVARVDAVAAEAGITRGEAVRGIVERGTA